MRTEAEIKAIADQVNALNNDDAPKQEGMVYQVWEDGEITLQKSGSLLWRRSLHCIVPGTESCSLGAHALVNKEPAHSFIWAKDEADAYAASRLIQPKNTWIRVHFKEC